jgi:hypothetical protein
MKYLKVPSYQHNFQAFGLSKALFYFDRQVTNALLGLDTTSPSTLFLEDKMLFELEHIVKAQTPTK